MTKAQKQIKRAGYGAAWRAVLAYLLLCGLFILGLNGFILSLQGEVPWLIDLLRYDQWIFLGGSALLIFVLFSRISIRHRLSEYERAAQAQTLSTLFGNLPGLAYRCAQDFQRSMLFVSEGCRQLTGYSPQELVKNRLISFDQLIHPDDREAVTRNLTESLEQKRSYRLTYRILSKNSQEKWVLEQGCGIDEVDGHFVTLEGLLVDISKQKAVELQLEQQRKHLEKIVRLRTEELSESIQSLEQEIERRQALELSLRELSTRDQLTGLYNRRVMDNFLSSELKRCGRYKHPLSLLMFDLDHFKNLNDTYGHQAGDEVLRWVSSIIRTQVRENDRAVRYGGEEFLIILPETEKEAAHQVAERLRIQLSEGCLEFQNEDDELLFIQLTLSAGVASFPQDARTVEGLLAGADQALYRAKRTGRDRVCCHGAEN